MVSGLGFESVFMKGGMRGISGLNLEGWMGGEAGRVW